MTSTTPQDTPFDLERLLPDAIGAILDIQDAEEFFTWMDMNMHHYVYDAAITQPKLFAEDNNIPEDMLRRFGRLFAHSLWNITPLPQKNFHTDPLPLPGRNSPCPCGSGHKFKRCCQAAYAEMPPLGTHDVWPIVLDAMNDELREKAVQSRQLPVEMLAAMANEYLLEDTPKKGLKLLEPLFEKDIPGTDKRHDFAFNILCDIYERLGYERKKMRLIERITESCKRSPLRAGGWQRLAAIRMDNGDNEGAWKALQYAQRDNPGDPYLGVLEIQLLLAEDRVEEARNRAIFWKKQIRNYEADDELVEFFAEIAHDPYQAFMDMSAPLTAEADPRLQDWLDQTSRRPVPEYRLQVYTPEEDLTRDQIIEQTRKQLQMLGLPRESIEDFLERAPDDNPNAEETPEYPESAAALETPPRIVSLEQDWETVFPLGKPISTHDAPFADDDPWDPEISAEWLQWLERHPEAGDSLSILDDIATALLDHPSGLQPWIVEKLLEPVLNRSVEILDQALKTTHNDTPPTLEWAILENRPALRSLARMIRASQYWRDERQTIAWAEKLLALNPNDNHGVRTLLMTHLLKEERNREALELARQYPEDINPELAFGEALAWFRLGEKQRAAEALQEAHSALPKIIPMLLRKTVRKPKLSEEGVRFGGDDQAWYYREAARDLWLKTPGAMEWLKRFK